MKNRFLNLQQWHCVFMLPAQLTPFINELWFAVPLPLSLRAPLMLRRWWQ